MQRTLLSFIYLMSFCVADIARTACVRQATANCTAMTGMKTCTATLRCSDVPMIYPYKAWILTFTGSGNVSACTPVLQTLTGDPVTFSLKAVAKVTAPNPRFCSWSWKSAYNIQPGTTSINSGDGLPVELLEFGIE